MMRLIWIKQWSWGITIAFTASYITTGCSLNSNTEPIREIQIQQNWAIQPGDYIANHLVVAGLGDISIRLGGDAAYAPFVGRVERNSTTCVLFSSPEVPAYLFRLCGLDHPRLGAVQSGDVIGAGEYLYFATLRKQPDGTWTMVEPAKDILQRMMNPP